MSPNSKRVIIVGGGPAGLSAAYTLKKRGISPILFEANDRVGGRLGGDRVDGFHIDEGADFFCSSYDVTFRICQELGLPLVKSQMNLGWYLNGKWVRTTPPTSLSALFSSIAPLRTLGFLSPSAAVASMKLLRHNRQQADCVNFSSTSRIAEIDSGESFGQYMDRVGIPQSLRKTFRGFLEMTMGDVDDAGAAYMRTYLADILFKSHELYIPEKGAGELSHALAGACGDAIRPSTPVRNVAVKSGAVTGVAVEGDTVEADAVICAVPATRVSEIIPALPEDIREALGAVTYSSGCRVVMGLDRPPLPSGWYGVLYPEDETPLLLDRSSNLPSCVPPGKSTLDLLVGRERARELIPLDDEEIKHEMLKDARKNPPPGSDLPEYDEGLFTRVYRWKEAVCMAPPGMFAAMDNVRRNLSRQIPNLALAGDYMGVPSVNGAVASGISAAEDIADQLTAS